jgi:mono/diheme cytochrome c family protein
VLDVGAEPFDVVVSPELDRIFVSLSQEGAVVAIDPATFTEIDRWELGGEPRWLSIAELDVPTLVVAHADAPTYDLVDLDTGEVWTSSLPVLPRFLHSSCEPRDLQTHITGAPVVDGSDVFFPAVYVDTQLLETEHNLTSCFESDDTAFVGPTQNEGPAYYAPPVPAIDAAKISRFNGAVVRVDLTGVMAPEVMALSTREADNAGQRAIRGLPGDLAMSADGQAVLAPIPAMGRLISLRHDGNQTPEDAGAMVTRRRGLLAVPDGTMHVLSTPAQTYVYSPITRELGRRASSATSNLTGTEAYATMRTATPASVLPGDVERGRELFFSGLDSGMVQSSSGASCSACHADGRSDNLTWQFEDFPRQTPSLAGDISRTTPLTWRGELATVVEEIHATTQVRMGGTGITDAKADQLAAFVESVRVVQRPGAKTAVDEALVAEGRALFHDAEVACATCHVGEVKADGRQHAVLGFDVATDTPTLLGIGATAPYFHNGSADTLMAVLEAARDGSMGNTGHLSDDQMDALVAYLETL